MAILTFLCEVEDFASVSATQDTSPIYVSTTRVEHGFAITIGLGLSASWPEPAGNTIWIHWVHGQTTNSALWDDFGVPAFFDANGNQVLRLDITDAIHRWNLFGDTSPSASYSAVAGSQQVIDVQVTKNGTTNLIVNVWVNGVQRVTNLTAANTVNRGLPVGLITSHGDGNSQGTQVWSEGIIADEDTRGWRLRQHRPTAYGAFEEWAGTADKEADNVRKNRGITTNTADQRVSYTLSNLADIPVAATINRVCVLSTLIRGSTGLANFNHFWRYNSGPTVIHDSDIAAQLTLTEHISE